MADAFVSYSRRDAEFVRRLAEALTERGKEAWIDVAGIRDAEVFPAALRAAIEQSDGFVFVVSPDSVASAYCGQEVEHALELNKRIVPLLLRPVADELVPEGVRVRNWIPFLRPSDFNRGVARVVEALNTDLAWAREHTRWLLKALEWDAEHRERSFLLRGSELAAAEAWLAGAAGKEPEPNLLQGEYVAASRRAAPRRQRRLAALSVAIAAVSLALLIFALVSRSQAITARNTARSRAFGAESQTQLAVDPERSILLAEAALKQATTPEALFALRGALDSSPLRYRLPDAGLQSCADLAHGAPDLAYRPDGRRLAEAICGGVIVVADERGSVVRRIRIGRPVSSIAYSRDGALLAAATPPAVLLLDPSSGVVEKTLPNSAHVAQLAFSPSAGVLALGGVGKLTFVDVATGRARVVPFPASVRGTTTTALAFSADGRRLATGVAAPEPNTPSGVGIVDVGSGRLLAAAGADNIEDVGFSPDGGALVTAESGTDGGTISVRDVHALSKKRVLVRLPAVSATAGAFSPDGAEVAFGAADGTAGLVSPGNGQRITSYLGQTAAVTALRFSPDGRFVATASADGTTRVWRAAGPELRSFRTAPTVGPVEAVPGGLLAVLDRGPNARVAVQRSTDSGQPTGTPIVLSRTDTVAAAFVSGDGRLAGVIPAPARGQSLAPITIVDLARHRVVRTLPPSTAPFGGEPVFSPDGRLIAMGRYVTPSGAPSRSPAGPKPAIVLVNAATGRPRVLGTTDCGAGWRSQPFSRDGTLLAAGTFCGEVSVWDVASGHRIGQPFSIGGELARITFEPDGNRIAVAGWNSAITVANARTGRIDAVLTDHTRGVDDITWSPDGRYFASASLDDTARVWDAKTLRVLRILRHPDPVDGVSFTSDSRDVVTTDVANVVRVWDACTDCDDAHALLALAKSRVTRGLTAQERKTFAVG
jgi:WD40 repeat protein